MNRLAAQVTAAAQPQDGPLSGFLVVEFSTAVQGPTAGSYLRDMGAQVVKIEGPVGDGNRHMIGEQASHLPRVSMGSQFVSVNLGKRSLSLDIKHPESMDVIRRLLDRADVFLVNFTQRALDELGLDYASLKARNPRLIYAVASGFGPQGPMQTRKGFDGVAQAYGGLVSITGTEEQPVLTGDACIDFMGGAKLALGIVTALLARERFGIGQQVQTSLYGSALWAQRWALTHAGMSGAIYSRQGSNAYAASPGGNGVYRTSDGHNLVLIFPIVGRDPDAAWMDLCSFGRFAELGTDPRFKTGGGRAAAENTEEPRLALRAGLTRIFESRSLAEWEIFFGSHDNFAWAPVLGHHEVVQTEQALANDYIVSVDIPGIGPKNVVGNVVNLSETPGQVRGPPPLIGADTKAIMQELGFDGEAVSRVLGHTKQMLIDQAGEKLAKKLTAHLREYWD